MKLEGERWRALVSTVRLGRDEYRVVQPARPLSHAPLFEGYQGVEALVDKASAREMAMAWEFATRSPRTLVYLPLKQSDAACRWSEGPLLDLVLVHHSLGFRLSRWKQVRAKLGNGRPHTVVCRGFRQEPDYRRLRQRDNLDLLRGEIVADTVFLVGSRAAFGVGGQALKSLVEHCPRHMHESPGTHCCAEIDEGRQNWNWLHVVYCDEHRVHA